ncbi:MAG: sigma-70 family RNA polymerase sigma factor [bacterium]|nr:sigma-70 family RNA polymerase sigma factor [bacterium]
MTVPLHADHALVRAARRKEPDAVDWLSEKLEIVPRIIAVLARRKGVRAPEVLADLSQEAVLTALRRLDTYHGLAPLDAWLQRICENTVRGYQRRERLRAANPLEHEPASHERTPDEIAEAEEQRRRVSAAIDAIGGSEAEILRLRYQEGMDYRDIAARAGIPFATCRTRYYRGFQKLRDRLDGDNQEDLR